jgi:ankyrin repeat protein
VGCHTSSDPNTLSSTNSQPLLFHFFTLFTSALHQDQRTPLHIAAAKGHTDIASILLVVQADSEAVDSVLTLCLFNTYTTAYTSTRAQ